MVFLAGQGTSWGMVSLGPARSHSRIASSRGDSGGITAVLSSFQVISGDAVLLMKNLLDVSHTMGDRVVQGLPDKSNAEQEISSVAGPQIHDAPSDFLLAYPPIHCILQSR